jgi:hypothetical protein
MHVGVPPQELCHVQHCPPHLGQWGKEVAGLDRMGRGRDKRMGRGCALGPTKGARHLWAARKQRICRNCGDKSSGLHNNVIELHVLMGS